MPSMAGMSGMRYRTFFAWNAAGGGDLGARMRAARDTPSPRRSGVIGETLTWAPLAILAVIIAIYVLIHLRRRRPQATVDHEGTARALRPRLPG